MASPCRVTGSKFEFSVEPGEFKSVVLHDSGIESEFVDVENEVAGLFDAAEGRNTWAEKLSPPGSREFPID